MSEPPTRDQLSGGVTSVVHRVRGAVEVNLVAFDVVVSVRLCAADRVVAGSVGLSTANLQLVEVANANARQRQAVSLAEARHVASLAPINVTRNRRRSRSAIDVDPAMIDELEWNRGTAVVASFSKFEQVIARLHLRKRLASR